MNRPRPITVSTTYEDALGRELFVEAEVSPGEEPFITDAYWLGMDGEKGLPVPFEDFNLIIPGLEELVLNDLYQMAAEEAADREAARGDYLYDQWKEREGS